MMSRTAMTEESLRADLEALGVSAAQTLVVHSSLSSIGWVDGGAATVVRALIATLGDQGTLAMPAATPQCAHDADQHERELPPLFDRQGTPTSMGAVAESFRTWPGVLRSDHPLESVCALGRHAAEITVDHPLDFSEGPGAPFGALYELESLILLLGVGFNRCTALHYAETRVEKRRTMRTRVSKEENGERVWVDLVNVADDNDTYFPLIGERYLAAAQPSQGPIGKAASVLLPMRELVDHARTYFEEVL